MQNKINTLALHHYVSLRFEETQVHSFYLFVCWFVCLPIPDVKLTVTFVNLVDQR